MCRQRIGGIDGKGVKNGGIIPSNRERPHGPRLHNSDFRANSGLVQTQNQTYADDRHRRTGQETENASSDETCLYKSQVRPISGDMQMQNATYANRNRQQSQIQPNLTQPNQVKPNQTSLN